MSCLCDKLRTGNYSEITAPEACLLQQAWKQAPELFTGPERSHAGNQDPSSLLSPPESSYAPRGAADPVPYPDLVIKLERTFPRDGLEAVLASLAPAVVEDANPLHSDVYVRIFLSVEKSNLLSLLGSYALATLHPRGASIDYIVERVHGAIEGNSATIRSKLNKMLWRGRQWHQVVEAFQQVGEGQAQRTPPSTLKPAGTHEPLRHGSKAQSSDDRNLELSTELYTSAATTTPVFPAVAAAVAAVSNILPTASTPTAALLTLISLMGASGGSISMEAVQRVIRPQRRWDLNGNFHQSSGSELDITPELLTPLPADEPGLHGVLSELSSLGAISHQVAKSGELVLNHPVGESLRAAIASGAICSSSIWRQQAVFVACRLVRFKYLEPPITPQQRQLAMSLFEYGLDDLRGHSELHLLPERTRVGIASCLVEASRWSGLPWKNTAIQWAKDILGDTQDAYLNSCITQREIVMHRLTGKTSEATDKINRLLARVQTAGSSTALIHSSIGHAVIERALNHFQAEELAMALATLDFWSPTTSPPTPAESTVLVRAGLLQGKILRYQGNFTLAYNALTRCRRLIEQNHPQAVIFDEDRTLVTCELAYTLYELDRLGEAEEVLNRELQQPAATEAARQLPSLALAEVLLAQNRLDEAEAVCHDHSPVSAKLPQLHLCITMAKIQHMRSDWVSALSWWTQALQAINKFPPTSGHATWTIYMSIVHVLGKQGYIDTAQHTLKALEGLEQSLDGSEAKYWIAGLRKWSEYVK
ncbi:hypothetical protein N0V84_012639 [Fusarium piperis]|uniref:Uncharacterized protein n=1 Tax=Fusarium piperis TaxID=1435070 RepID=A0A9W8W253_9HYPO|nr:hypothetical protein N0V84_012639 [Fusarium piperis]